MKPTPYIAGILFGDGTSHKAANGAYSVWIDQVDKEILKQNVVPQLETLGSKVHFYSYFAKADNVQKWRALVHSKTIYLWFKKLKQNPSNYVEQLSNKEMKEFVAGLFDAEGTITDRLVFYNKNKELLDMVKERLDALGIRSNLYKFGKVYGIQLYRKEYVEKFRASIPSFRLKVHSAD